MESSVVESPGQIYDYCYLKNYSDVSNALDFPELVSVNHKTKITASFLSSFVPTED
jgi:hypothetical protein